MMEQLDAIDVEEWPKVLIKHLKKNKSEIQDVTYQSEVYQADIEFHST